uniref:Immunoglobulin domain-containing protein n=1 Tax=Spermophilus dauricus TaxID=99837 RepID=A0A8C9PSV2_SPEDA
TSYPLIVLLLKPWWLPIRFILVSSPKASTKPSLWAEPESLLEPWANVTLRCQARLATLDFQLLKDGVTQELVHLSTPTMEHQFLLGAVTSDNQGLYRCRSRFRDGRWTALSNLLEVTGTEPLPPPWLSTETVPWITPGLNTTLLCHGGLLGVIFLLGREGDDEFLEVAEAGKGREVTFPVHRAGNYSCSYRTHTAGDPSEPSTLPAPVLVVEPEGTSPATGSLVRLRCRAPRAGLRFALNREGAGGQRLSGLLSPAGPEAVFELPEVSAADTANYSCIYVDPTPPFAGSAPSAPLELRVDGELGAGRASA